MENGINIYDKLTEIVTVNQMSMIFDNEAEKSKLVAEHKVWLNNIRKERPNPAKEYNVGVTNY